ncbi:Crp/Fnr family transcriptional regulator [Streptomyces huiliensis]|uniref:Crp/Fnr family transcriptional regulator n=1 Tax=Streptomyces huiliensis TaxID=2876027 RepID=UPI001CBC461D|nr:Crp/Fnr family transcriptional regulator [Streptomyces huiliensis]MBZ4323609.1 Crp/Fnr family transcriptional regulator [Streptomyces huiliensis]
MDGTTERHDPALGVTFARLAGEPLWNRLLEEGRTRRHRAGDTLLRQGDTGTHVLALVAGVVKVIRVERDGRVRVLAFRGAGDVVGEAAVLEEGERRLASVTAIGDVTAVVVEERRFRAFVARHGLSPVLTRHALTRLRQSDRARGGCCSRERVAQALLALAEAAYGGRVGDGTHLSVTRAELAQYLGVSRNTVSAALREIGDRVVGAERGGVVVHDLNALRTVASVAEGPYTDA